MKKMFSLRVDGIITDRPDIVKKIKLKSPINELPRTVRRIKTGLLIKENISARKSLNPTMTV
jgi:hypothetical protein